MALICEQKQGDEGRASYTANNRRETQLAQDALFLARTNPSFFYTNSVETLWELCVNFPIVDSSLIADRRCRAASMPSTDFLSENKPLTRRRQSNGLVLANHTPFLTYAMCGRFTRRSFRYGSKQFENASVSVQILSLLTKPSSNVHSIDPFMRLKLSLSRR